MYTYALANSLFMLTAAIARSQHALIPVRVIAAVIATVVFFFCLGQLAAALEDSESFADSVKKLIFWLFPIPYIIVICVGNVLYAVFMAGYKSY